MPAAIMSARIGGPLTLRLVLALALLAAVPAFPQAGGSQEQPPPKQEPGPRSSGGGNSGGVGVGVNVGGLIKDIFGRHAKVHLHASTQKVQVGDPILFTTTVTPQANGLSYEYHWSNDKNTPAEMETIPSLNHSYSASGEYKVSVVVYQGGKKVATSNEVKVKVEQGEQAGPAPTPVPTPVPSPDRVPPVVVAQGGTPEPSPAASNPPATPTPMKTPSPSSAASTPVKRPPPHESPTPAPTVSAGIVNVLPAVVPTPISYSLVLHGDALPESGKPANFVAQLTPEPPPGKHLRYCFAWGDGDLPSCQSAPSAVHTYRAQGKYLAVASVDELEGGENERKLAASEPLAIDAGKPLWLALLPVTALVLVVLAAAYGAHKARKFLHGTVTVHLDPGRHTIAPQTLKSGESLRIRCVRSPARSQIRFLSAGDKREAASA
jgi:hypothetical protein